MRGSLLPNGQGPVGHLHGGFEPPADVEQDPSFVGVVSDRLEKQIMRNAVEKGPDIKVQHPILFPAALSGDGQRVMGAAPRTIAVTVRVEDRLQPGFQQHCCRGLGHPVGRVRDSEHPDPPPMILRYLHRPHRSREVASRGHPIPQQVEVVPLALRELGDADGVHARRPVVGPDLLPRLKHQALGDLKRFHLRLGSGPRLLPRRVGLGLTLVRPGRGRDRCAPPPLRSGPITGPSPLLRAGPPLCPGSVLCPTRLPPAGVLPLAGRAAQPAHLGQVGTGTTGSPVPCQRLRRAHATYTPDTTRPARRPPPGSQHTTTIGCAFIPGTPDNPGFDAIVLFFRCVSSGSHTFVFSSPT